MPIDIITLRAEPISSAGFAPFGQVIGQDQLRIEARDGETLHLDILSKKWQPLRITSFNRHFKATQAQVALNGKPTVIVVGPGDVDLDRREDLDHFRAFICDGSTGFNLALRTWHAGSFPLMDSVEMVNLQGLRPDIDIEIRDISAELNVAIDLQL